MNQPAGLQVGKKVLRWPESGDSYVTQLPTPVLAGVAFYSENFWCLGVVGSYGED